MHLDSIFTERCCHDIAQTNVDISSLRFLGNHISAISQDIPQPLISKISLKIPCIEFLSIPAGTNELMIPEMPGTFSTLPTSKEPLVSDPGMHHATCMMHVPWCMSRLLTRGDGETVPGIPGACTTAIFRICQEAHMMPYFCFFIMQMFKWHFVTPWSLIVLLDSPCSQCHRGRGSADSSWCSDTKWCHKAWSWTMFLYDLYG